MIALAITLGYCALGVVCARWIFNRKAEEYYHRFTWLPKKCYAYDRHWSWHTAGCRCKAAKSVSRARGRAAFWCMLGFVWPLIPAALYLSAPSPFEQKIEQQKKDAEELEKLREFVQEEGWEL